MKARDCRGQTDVGQIGTVTDGKSTQEKPCGPVVTVSHIESPGDFFIQAVDDSKDVQR